MIKRTSFLVFFYSCIAFSSEITLSSGTSYPGPYFTGPLLTPTSHAIPRGHVNIEPYLFVTTNTGEYNANREFVNEPNMEVVIAQLPMQIGMTPWMDIEIIPQFISKFSQGANSSGFGDFSIGFEIQLLMDQPTNSYPAIKLEIMEILPAGKYDNLNPSKNETDAIGSGSWVTSAGLVMSRLFKFNETSYLSAKTAFIYNYFSPVHVSNFNTYGGGFGTSGRVFPGNSFSFYLAGEFTWTLHWAFACDLLYVYTNKTRFSGEKGVALDGSQAVVGEPSSEQWSLAPALEYNWNAHWGVIAGAWFTFAGRNSDAFISGVIAVNYYR